MIKFLQSFFYFLLLFFLKKKVDIIFYYPQHFNRGANGDNLYFEPLFEACRNNNVSYLIFEEVDSNSDMFRNRNAIPFDFIFYLILILRKFKLTDIFIGNILSRTFLRGLEFNNYIVLSQSMLEVFKGINNEAILFDLQHGIIHNEKENYIINNKVSDSIFKNKIQLLLSGFGFYNLLKNYDESNYFSNNSHVIGFSKLNNKTLHTCSNKNILVTLQFTSDHSAFQNEKLLNELDSFIRSNLGYTFYLKSHPRYNNEIDFRILTDQVNTKLSPSYLSCCFQKCSIHLTAYSTTSFESARVGIPTIFLTSLNDDFNMFSTDFYYPLNNDLKYIESNYVECSELVKKWEADFYSDFNESKFISLLK